MAVDNDLNGHYSGKEHKKYMSRKEQKAYGDYLLCLWRTITDGYGHSIRVAERGMRLWEKVKNEGMGKWDGQISRVTDDDVRLGLMLHDIEKVAKPAIYNKPGPLTDRERLVVKEHPVAALTVLSGSGLHQKSLQVIAYHHEAYDGHDGYPMGIAYGAVPLVAEVAETADVLDALLSNRTYREAMSLVATVAQLTKMAGNKLDRWVVTVLLNNFESVIGVPLPNTEIENEAAGKGLVISQ